MAFTLKYWNGRGLMEVPRMCLALNNQFPGEDYVDERCKGNPGAMGNLEMNLGRMPVLETKEGSIGQSAAINFYVATQTKMLGESSLQAAQILSIVEHVKECKDAYYKLIPYGTVPSGEQNAKWFGADGASDFSGVADGSKRAQRYFSWFLGRLEGLVGDKGFAVGNSLSLADVFIFSYFGDNLDAKTHENVAAHKREAFGNTAKTNELLAAHPKIKAIVDNVASQENMKKWLQVRGHQGF